jgi:hypothetical protein
VTNVAAIPFTNTEACLGQLHLRWDILSRRGILSSSVATGPRGKPILEDARRCSKHTGGSLRKCRSILLGRSEAAIKLAGQVNSNGPGSTGTSSPDAAAPAPKGNTGFSGVL